MGNGEKNKLHGDGCYGSTVPRGGVSRGDDDAAAVGADDGNLQTRERSHRQSVIYERTVHFVIQSHIKSIMGFVLQGKHSKGHMSTMKHHFIKYFDIPEHLLVPM